MQDTVNLGRNLMAELEKLGYTGSVSFNYFKGGITNTKLEQSLQNLLQVRIVPIAGENRVEVNT